MSWLEKIDSYIFVFCFKLAMIKLNDIDIYESSTLENVISQYKFKDLIELPYIQFPETQNIPAAIGIYFVIVWENISRERGDLLYIGETINLKKRWQGHHHVKKIRRVLEKNNCIIDIYWHEINICNKEYLIAIETELIWHFQPMWNMQIRWLNYPDPDSGYGWNLGKLMEEKGISPIELSQKTNIRSRIIKKMMLLVDHPPQGIQETKRRKWIEKICQSMQCLEYELYPALWLEKRISPEDFEYLKPEALNFIKNWIKKGYKWRGVDSINEKFNLYIRGFCSDSGQCFTADFYGYLSLVGFEVKRANNGTFLSKVVFIKK